MIYYDWKEQNGRFVDRRVKKRDNKDDKYKLNFKKIGQHRRQWFWDGERWDQRHQINGLKC